MKAYTDIEQSKKLAEILPLESADMCYRYYSGGMITGYGDCVLAKCFITGKNAIRENDLPCWSLSSLLGVLPYPSLHKTFSGWRCDAFNREGTTCKLGRPSDNPVDACVDMIIKLYEQNLL